VAILGILGVETSFGQNKGSFRTIDALSTLAFGYPKRAEYFTDELAALLVLARDQGVRADSIKGSYAGAIGYPQFMPSNILKLGVDFDNDGHIDLMNDPEDAIGSVAHYLAEKGWQRGQPIGFAARYQGNDDTQVISKDLTQPKLAGDLMALGLTPIDKTAKIELTDLVNGVRLNDKDGPVYWITYPNYQVITTYNRSRLYATAVWQLGQAIVNRP
jgi:membrane-bound lytic murein transglycosylase B